MRTQADSRLIGCRDSAAGTLLPGPGRATVPGASRWSPADLAQAAGPAPVIDGADQKGNAEDDCAHDAPRQEPPSFGSSVGVTGNLAVRRVLRIDDNAGAGPRLDADPVRHVKDAGAHIVDWSIQPHLKPGLAHGAFLQDH